MTILFHRAIKIGDNVVAIRAIYAIKALFPSANLIVATNNIGANLYANLPFIDTLLNVEANPNAICAIPNIDFFIITHRITANIALAKATNAKKIIIRAHLSTLCYPRFINDFNFSTKMRPESENLLRIVRLIDKRIFDKGIKSVDFGNAKLRFAKQNSDFVEKFLAQMWQNQMPKNAIGGGQNKNVANFDGCESCETYESHESCKSYKSYESRKSRKLIGVNFFGSGGVGYFSLDSWREIVESLAREFSDFDFVVLCPPNAKLEPFSAPNVAIFVNNADLLNIVAMTARFNALISVDTGNVHIADNLQIPTLGIYTQKMLKRWRGGTYGGRFAPFVMPLHSDENDIIYKQKLLAFLKGHLDL